MADLSMRMVVIALILILLAGSVIFILYRGEGGFFPTVKKITDGIAATGKKIISIGPVPIEKVERKAPAGVEATYNSIIENINKYQYNPDKRCLISYKPLPEEECNINFLFNGDTYETTLVLSCKIQQMHTTITTSEPLPGIVPCMVHPMNFYDNWLGAFLPGKSLSLPEYYTYREFSIYWDFKRWNEPAILNYNLDDGGILYKVDDNHICFFATKWGDIGGVIGLGGCDAEAHVFDDDCIDDIKKAVPNCTAYDIKSKDLGYIAAALPGVEDESFIATAVVDYFDAPNVSAYVDLFDRNFATYFEVNVRKDKSKIDSFFVKQLSLAITSWLNGAKPGGIKEIKLIKFRTTSNDEAWYLYGASLIERGKAIEGRDMFLDVVGKYKSSDYAPLASYQLGEIYFKQDNYFTALIWYAGVVNDYPDTDAAEEAKKQIVNVCLVKPGKTTLPTGEIIDCNNLNQTKYYPEVKK